mmetsp:Transcript_17164/g.41661  ORF Transcript_17164/g.41661 Transcript_17164/m.41661 type:complete len:602 (+) Transcript_17164:225-2030(+)
MVPRKVKTNSCRTLVTMTMVMVTMMMMMMISSKSCHHQAEAVSTSTEEKLTAATSKQSIKNNNPKGEEDPRQRRLSKKKKKKEKKEKKSKKPKKPVRKPPFFGPKRDVIFPTTKPRVRREWRTLDLSERVKIANAMRMMKILTTDQGRQIYGSDLFWNIDDMTILHACSTTDPRCDQGHYGPHFMLFHRGYLLRFERSLLTVDPSIEALPYWDYAKDTETGECFEKSCYIFSDLFFGDIQGSEKANFGVTNGLFAWWPIAEYTDERFGPNSALAANTDNAECIKENYFVGVEADVCDKCCGRTDDCECTSTDKNTTWLRYHSDCTPVVARNPDEITPLDGTRNLEGTKIDFECCTDPFNIQNFLEWQNCIEFREVLCLFVIGASQITGLDCATRMQEVMGGNELNFLPEELCDTCTLTGFFFDRRTFEPKFPQALHSSAHIKTGRDILDVTTSPNDVGLFTGYHTNIDRSNMIWMTRKYLDSNAFVGMDTIDMAAKNYGYPLDINDDSLVDPATAVLSQRLSGPLSTYDALACSSDSFTEYELFGSQWLNGTTADEIINGGYPFTDIFDEPPANGKTYSAKEIIFYSEAVRSQYTYDTMEQ